MIAKKVSVDPHSAVSEELHLAKREFVREAAIEAIQKSWNQVEELYAAWSKYGIACKNNGFASLAEVLCDEYRNGKTLFEEAIDSGDPRTLRYLHGCIGDGTYADGKIIRTPNSLYKVIDKESGIGFGYLAHPLDNLYTGYTGHIKSGERHGWGRFDYGLFDHYEGSWERGDRHGFGRILHETPYKKIVEEALFEQDQKIKTLKKTRSPSELNFFSKIKTILAPPSMKD